MRTFITKTALFLAIQAVVAMGIFSLTKPGENGWLMAGVEKRHRLQTAPAPRMVFIGGSSVCFGLDSELIEKKLGVSPVNMGLHAGLGMDYIIDEAEHGLKSGDVLIVSFEYAHFLNDQTQWAMLANSGMSDMQSFARMIRVRPADALDHGLVFGSLYARLLMHRFDRVPYTGDFESYRRDAFNVYGEVVRFHQPRITNEPGSQSKEFSGPLPPFFEKSIAKLVDLQKWCRQRGVTMYWAYPPIADFAFDPRLAKQLKAQFDRHSIVQIDRPEDNIYPAAMFWDTEYHVNREGAKARTTRLIDLLRPLLARDTLNHGTNADNIEHSRLAQKLAPSPLVE